MTKLNISDKLSLPIDFVTSTQVILAQKGKGKTHTAIVEAEELLDASQQVVVIDPTDAWWGLRSSPDGRSTGYPIAVFGGDHGDVALEPSGGRLLAAAIVSEGFSAIVSTENLSKTKELTFVADFMEELYRLNRKAMHLFVDEADIFAPQKPFGGEARTCGAADDIVRRGRKKGIGCTLITQRSSVLNKNVLSQADMLMALGCSHPRDLDAVGEWVKVHADPKLAAQMMESLPALPRGDAWAWNPAADIFKRITIRDRHTFDSGRTPKPGEAKRVAKVLAPVDIQRLGATIAAQVDRAKESDPAALKAKVRELEKRLADKVDHSARTTDALMVAKKNERERPVVKEAQVARIEKMIDRMVEASSHFKERAAAASSSLRALCDRADGQAMKLEVEVGLLRSALAAAQSAKAEARHPAPVHQPKAPKIVITRSGYDPKAPRVIDPTLEGKGISGGLRRILTALAQREETGLTSRQIGIRAGLSSQSGTFSTYLSRARKEGWIADQGEKRHITNAGIEALGAYTPLPTGPELADYWLGQLKNSGAARILRVLIEAYPTGLDNQTIGERATISHASGTFSTYMSKLRGLELIVGGRGDTSASEELFS